MPELPEVETVASQLKPQLLGKRLISLRIHDLKLQAVSGKIPKNSVIRDVRRVGKQVLIEWLSPRGKRFLYVHLRMTGRLLWLPKSEQSKMNDKPRAEFRFAEGCLAFVDVRRFGTIEVSSDPESCCTVGCDPFSPDFTPAALATLVAGSKQPIKPWLLRQDKIVGLGNIYR